MKELIFIYNAKSGLTQAAVDWAHKIISPKTYECSLCSLTYGNLGKYSKWSKFLESLNMNKSFIYDDQLSDLSFYNNESLPCIFLREDDNYSLLLNNDELDRCENLDALINLIKVELDHDKTLPSCNSKRFDE